MRAIVVAGLAALLSVSCESAGDLGEAGSALSTPLAGTWQPLGGELVLDPGAWVSAPSLARGGARMAMSENDTTYVRTWSDDAWADLGAPLAGNTPSAAGRFVCRIDGAYVSVSQWANGAWSDVGSSPVDVEALQADTWFRYYANSCSLAIDGAGRPVVAWSAHVGAKYDLAFAAQWRKGAWHLLGTSDGIGADRATDARLALGPDDRPIVATFEPGGSYGGGATTRVFALRDDDWVQIGDDLTQTSWPTIAAGSSFMFLAVVTGDYAHETDRVAVFRASVRGGGGWHELRGTFSQHGDDVPALAVTGDDHPVIALSRDSGVVIYVRDATGWDRVGPALAGFGGYVTAISLAVSTDDVPTVAWLEQVFGDLPTSSVHAMRFAR